MSSRQPHTRSDGWNEHWVHTSPKGTWKTWAETEAVKRAERERRIDFMVMVLVSFGRGGK